MKTNKRKKYNKFLWVEAFRPEHVKDMLLPDKLKKNFLKLIDEKNIPNLLLYSSSPGVGKTTLAKALCNDIGADYLYINTSSESGIETLRATVKKFASTKSFNGAPKVVIMDEFDGASKNLQQGLRAAIEEFHNVCRFIFMANYISQIIEPLKSRCQVFDMNMTETSTCDEMKPKIKSYLKRLLDFKQISYQDETAEKMVDQYFPDIRNMIQTCQQYSSLNGSIDDNIFSYQKIDEDFYDFI